MNFPYLKLLAILLFLSSACRKPGPQEPNIIIILADDMGYSDLGCMGSEIRTPHLDKLAKEGLLFTHCYNAARCCPSRASLLTGLYPHQAGIGHMDRDLGTPSYQGYLNHRSVTIAEVLKERGYHTIMCGKWHVGDEREHWPDKRGFEQFYGIPRGGGLYFYPSRFIDRPVYRNGEELKPNPDTFYTTDNFTDEAIGFIRAARSNKKPFFLYLAYIAPHFPLQAWPEDIARYKGVYDTGYGPVRQKRFNKQRTMGIVGEDVRLSPPGHIVWDSVEDKGREALKMAVYAAQIDRMDQNIGKLVNALKEMGLYENTMILFFSDNGASAEDVDRSPGAEIGTAGSFASYGKNWANVSNTPYRFFKGMTHEGGVLTPLIVHWPRGIVQKGRLIRDAVHLNDIMPTCLELAGASYPERFRGNQIQAHEGQSFAHFFKGKAEYPSRALYWEHEGNRAVRRGDWKLVKAHRKPRELYYLGSDPTELEDLAAGKPAVADSLERNWNDWAEQAGVLSWPVHSSNTD